MRVSYKAWMRDGSTARAVSIAAVEVGSGYREAVAGSYCWRWERRIRKDLLEKMTLKLRFTVAKSRVMV